MLARFAFLLLWLGLSLGSAWADAGSARILVHVLDYLAKDYPGAVAGGRVLDAAEFREQVEFSESAVVWSDTLPETRGEPEIRNEIRRLRDLISQRSDPGTVSALARAVQDRVVAVSRLEVAPRAWPDLSNGRKLFAGSCSSCHGTTGRGDGPLGKVLKPPPADFHDPGRMEDLSPFRAYNTIRLGVPGTGMPPFAAFADKDAWDLAFYVVSLRHQPDAQPPGAGEEPGQPPSDSLLRQAATLSDRNLRATLTGTTGQVARILSMLRRYSGTGASVTGLSLARERLDRAGAAYGAGDVDGARAAALQSYLEGVEPVEPRLRASDASVVLELENRMALVRSAIEGRRPVAEVRAAVDAAARQLVVAERLLGRGPLSPVLTFLTSAGVVLREGFEAVLIILVLLGVVRAAGSKAAALWVHAGWVTALGLGVLAWVCSGRLMEMSGAGREMLEGITSLLAVALLLSVGFWLHSQTEARRWKSCIESKLRTALCGRNLLGLAAISFVAVFREAVETVLFLRAVTLESGSAGGAAMGAGVAAAGGAIVILTWAFLRCSSRVPIRQVFALSAALMAVLAVVLAGKGLHAMQESGAIPVTAVPMTPRWELLGLYPTVETVASQLVTLALGMVLWHLGRKPRSQSTAMA